MGVAALEWLDPVFVAGHWTPQLIEYAGGIDLLGLPGEKSETRSWEEVAAARPEVVVVMPCGYDAERSLEEAESYADELAELGARRVVAVDASAYYSRPGPRLVDGLELMAHILHPELVPRGAGAGARGPPLSTRQRRRTSIRPLTWPAAPPRGRRVNGRRSTPVAGRAGKATAIRAVARPTRWWVPATLRIAGADARTWTMIRRAYAARSREPSARAGAAGSPRRGPRCERSRGAPDGRSRPAAASDGRPAA